MLLRTRGFPFLHFTAPQGAPDCWKGEEESIHFSTVPCGRTEKTLGFGLGNGGLTDVVVEYAL